MQGIALKVWGDFALFSRPEFAAERVSYEVMTPSAARGIVEAIHWKPAIRWVIDRIQVLNPIRFDTIRRNEVGSKLPYGSAKEAWLHGTVPGSQFADEDRQQRASLVLRNVAYVIEAHFTLKAKPGAGESEGKHLDMARRRIARGQCMQQPCFGCREFPAYFAPADTIGGPDRPHVSLKGERKLGWMLHDIDFAHNNTPRFFPAMLTDGVLQVPPFESLAPGVPG